MTGRGKKLNRNKNAGSARDFAAGKKFGRPKQVWVWHDLMGNPNMPKPWGHWEKRRVKSNVTTT
jgi:hypothetical protein